MYPGDVAPLTVQVARRLEEYNAALGHPRDYPVPEETKARIRTEVATALFHTVHGRAPRDARELAGQVAKASRPRTTAVAGYDLTFSPVKSVSALWALAPPEIAAQVEQAHHAAVTDALAFIEDHVLYTREGTNGVRQVEVTGLVAARFTHRDSRAGDPDLHTHVAVANKVQARQSGKWLAIDGRPLHTAVVAASETYNTRLEAHLRDRLGLTFAERPGTDRSKRPIREVVGVDPHLNQAWSQRRQSIEARRSQLTQAFQRDHGRPPTVVESIQLAQQATLETREAKHEPRTLDEQRTAWRAQAEDILGGPDGVAGMIRAALSAGRDTAPVRVDTAWVQQAAARVLAQVQARRSTWQVWHVRAEADRQIRPATLTATDIGTVLDLVVDAALDASVRLSPDGRRDHRARCLAPLRRRQHVRGRRRPPVHQPRDPGRRAAPRRRRRPGRTARRDRTGRHRHLLEQAANHAPLNAGQTALVRSMATSGAALQLAIAPAGAGKTTAMRALTSAWTEDGGTVIGLAPSAAAAAVLRESTGADTDTLAKLVHSLTHRRPARLGRPDRAADPGRRRRGRDGRHPLPRHRRRVRPEPGRAGPAHRRRPTARRHRRRRRPARHRPHPRRAAPVPADAVHRPRRGRRLPRPARRTPRSPRVLPRQRPRPRRRPRHHHRRGVHRLGTRPRPTAATRSCSPPPATSSPSSTSAHRHIE